MSPQPGINFYSYLDSSGYGRAGLDYLIALQQAGYPLSWEWVYWEKNEYLKQQGLQSTDRFQAILAESGLTDEAYRALGQLAQDRSNLRTSLFYCAPDAWDWFSGAGSPRVGMTVWETDRLPKHWKLPLENVEQVIVPGEFCRRVFEGSGITTPITIIPHIYRQSPAATDFDDLAFRQRFQIPPNDFIFYAIEEWTPRKALWDTIGAYLLAFDDKAAVTLVLKTSMEGVVSPRTLQKRAVREYVRGISANFPHPANIILIDEKVSDEDITGMHKAGNAYVSLTRGEGWGLGSFNAAAHGNPVIITGWGGQLDFLGGDYPFLLNHHMIPVINKAGENSYARDQYWARADIDHAISMMRDLYGNPDKSREMVASVGSRIIRDHSPEKIVKMFEQFI